MLWPFPSAGGTNCGCTPSGAGCQQTLTTTLSFKRAVCLSGLCPHTNTSLLLLLKRLVSLCLSAVPGVRYPARPGREAQKVSGVSWGVRVRRPEPLFGHCLPVHAPAAVHPHLPLKQHGQGRTSHNQPRDTRGLLLLKFQNLHVSTMTLD